MENKDPRSHPKYDGTEGKQTLPFKPEMVFLAEDTEAYGLITDVCPLAKGGILVAAGGSPAWEREESPLYSMSENGLNALSKTVFQELCPHPAAAAEGLKLALGHEGKNGTNPVSRYFAALAEVIAMQITENQERETSHEQLAVLLNRELTERLAELRRRISATVKGRDALEDAAVALSLCVCRLQSETAEDHILDIYAAGSFRVYLLDEAGMSPVWCRSPIKMISGKPVQLQGQRIHLRHKDPFAILLVSESIYDPRGAEKRPIAESKGMVWRNRLCMEDDFFRLISDCVYDYEFGERAMVFFGGHLQGRYSAVGALSLYTGGASFEVFRNRCRNRLSELEKLMGLFPQGYDSANPPTLPPRQDVELRYLQELTEKNPTYLIKAREALRDTVLSILSEQAPATLPPPPAGVPEYQRPSHEEIHAVFASFDCENYVDRERIRENRAMLREILSEHWVTLRPVLLADAPPPATNALAARVSGERIYNACLDMNRRLTVMLARRKHTVLRLEEILSDRLEALRFEGNDWICARAGSESTDAWMGALQRELPAVLEFMEKNWKQETEDYRCLHSAYTGERERLFRLDTKAEIGFFSEDWESLIRGDMTEERADRIRELLSVSEQASALMELWDAALRISYGTGALTRRILARAAENRTAREFTARLPLCIAALRGAAYEDPAWGETVLAVLDTATRNDFRATVRRWQETDTLIRRQAEAYAEYSATYSRYL